MYLSSVGGSFFKAQVQNHYEKIRCDLYIKDISKRHVHSLTNMNKSIKEVRDTLRDIQASSGHCKEVLYKSNAKREQEWSRRMSLPNDGNVQRSETQAIQKSKKVDSDVSNLAVDAIGHRCLFPERNELSVVEHMENSLHGKTGAGSGNEMNGDRSDIVPDSRLLSDETLMLPHSRNVSSKVIQGASRQGMDSTVSAKDPGGKEPQGESQVKSLGSNSPNADTISESAIGSSKLGKSRPNTCSDGLMGSRSRTAPEKAPRLKSQVKSAQTSKSELKKNSGSRYLSASDVKKVKIHVSLSRTERKRLLEELISGCTVPCDRSVLERQRQRRLQEKIQTFFELLFEQDDKYDKDDESDISGDD